MKSIGISGKFTSGKDTLARYIMTRVYGYCAIALADSLKELCTTRLLTEVVRAPVYEAFTTLGRQAGIPLVASRVKRTCEDIFTRYPDEMNTVKPRQILQQVGGKFRELDEDIWVKILLAKVAKMEGNAIVTDVRYKNEKRILEQNGYVMIRLHIDQAMQFKRYEQLYGTPTIEKLSHRSETDLDLEEFSITIPASDTPRAWDKYFDQIRRAIQ